MIITDSHAIDVMDISIELNNQEHKDLSHHGFDFLCKSYMKYRPEFQTKRHFEYLTGFSYKNTCKLSFALGQLWNYFIKFAS